MLLAGTGIIVLGPAAEAMYERSRISFADVTPTLHRGSDGEPAALVAVKAVQAVTGGEECQSERTFIDTLNASMTEVHVINEGNLGHFA